MSKQSTQRWSKRSAMRLRGFRDRVSRWQARARRAATLALVTAGIAATPTLLHAQMGQTAMAPAGGIVNRAVSGFQGLNDNGPGVLYYGINAADRGLGYLGSYMTLGGFVPMFEDDLGGFWSADLRGHLSVYGGFFSNVGAVRKQLIGGSLLGVGIYWDYDGDLNQYSDTVITSGGTNYVFPGGQVYNQVGISGEWLTDWGNLRSNGYIPVGQTGEIVGPFLGNSILCVNGINAALAGTDLEVGAYIPGLADWAGMISVGGYAYGNTRYQFAGGQGAVPWFGGVYTRLDVTLIENWDFSLQYNNDSFFDSTGFARLTYRMGGSRRRNVPDQVEQPMMRNEHIVRAHQAPEVAINPANGLPWNVYFVDNSVATGGSGTANSPFTTLGEAETAATATFDIVYVAVGNSATQPYVTPTDGFNFSAPNQILVGEGSSLALPTLNCGPTTFFAGADSVYPVISNQSASLLGLTEAAIVIDQPGTLVSHVQIVGSPIGISDGPGPGVTRPGVATVSDVNISGSPSPNNRRGVQIAHSDGLFNLDRIRLENLENDAVFVSATGASVNLTNSQIIDAKPRAIFVNGTDARVAVDNTTILGTSGIPGTSGTPGTLGTAIEAAGTGARITVANTTISGTSTASGAAAVTDRGLVASGTNATIIAVNTTVERLRGPAIVASGAAATIEGRNMTVRQIDGDGLVSSGAGANIVLASSTVSQLGRFGALVEGVGSGLYLTDGSRIEQAGSDGIHVNGIDNTVLVRDSVIQGSMVNGVFVGPQLGSTSTQVTLLRSQVLDSTVNGVRASGVGPTIIPGDNGVVQIFASEIRNAGLAGVLAEDSSVDIGRDPGNPAGVGTRIDNTGSFGILSRGLGAGSGFNAVRVRDSEILNVGVGIQAIGAAGTLPNPPAEETNNLIAIGNRISATTTGIFIQGRHNDEPGAPPLFVSAEILQNRITTPAAGTDISLQVLAPPAETDPILWLPITLFGTPSPNDLSVFNSGAEVALDPGRLGLYFGPPRIPVTPPNRATRQPLPVPTPPPPVP
jgi:hypothetical protein